MPTAASTAHSTRRKLSGCLARRSSRRQDPGWRLFLPFSPGNPVVRWRDTSGWDTRCQVAAEANDTVDPWSCKRMEDSSGGFFTTVAEQSRAYLARLNADGHWTIRLIRSQQPPCMHWPSRKTGRCSWGVFQQPGRAIRRNLARLTSTERGDAKLELPGLDPDSGCGWQQPGSEAHSVDVSVNRVQWGPPLGERFTHCRGWERHQHRPAANGTFSRARLCGGRPV